MNGERGTKAQSFTWGLRDVWLAATRAAHHQHGIKTGDIIMMQAPVGPKRRSSRYSGSAAIVNWLLEPRVVSLNHP